MSDAALKDIQDRVDKTEDNIGKLAINMATLIEFAKNSEKRMEETIAGMAKTIDSIQSLSTKVASMVVLEKEMALMKEGHNELKGDVRVYKHDMKNTDNAVAGIVEILKDVREKQTNTIADIKLLQEWKSQLAGGYKATSTLSKVFWTIFGGSIISGISILVTLIITGA